MGKERTQGGLKPASLGKQGGEGYRGREGRATDIARKDV